MFPSIIQVPEINSMRLFVFKWTPKDDLAVLKISGKSSYTPYSFQTISLCVNHQQTMYLPKGLLFGVKWARFSSRHNWIHKGQKRLITESEMSENFSTSS